MRDHRQDETDDPLPTGLAHAGSVLEHDVGWVGTARQLSGVALAEATVSIITCGPPNEEAV